MTGDIAPLWFPYTQMQGNTPPLKAVRTQGAIIELEDGRRLVDGISSWWTACHGYNHPHIVAAMQAQLADMPHVMFGGLVHEPAVRLANRLTRLLGGGLNHVFFSDSGSVSVEVAMKMAVQYWRNGGEVGRTRFVCFRNGYHGDTMGAMSVCDPDEGMHRAFAGYLPDQIIVDVPEDADGIAAFRRLLMARGREIAAVIIEPLVQGAGGMKFHDASVLAAIHGACREAGVLFVADEIATGFGRTGQMFACQEAGVAPDIVCLSKALTGGTIALAATVASDAVYDAFLSDDPDDALMHGPTYMANPLACAAANASLDLFAREPRLDQVAAIAEFLRPALAPCADLPGVVDVRVKGAIGVVQLERMRDLAWLRRRFVEEGVWLRPFGDIVYIMPPFIVTSDELTKLCDSVVTVLTEWGHG